jgi:hypothetical protein
MKVVLVCIAKDEDSYIEEWLSYYKKLGFDEIVMYQNDWECKIVLPYLKKLTLNGPHKQMEAYRDFTNNYRNLFDWAAFFDCDEFLVLKKHKTIQEFLTEYDNPYGITINWQFFGADGKLTRGDHPNSLLKQFFLKQKDVNEHVKSILNLSSGSFMVSPHHASSQLMTTDREFFKGPFNRNGKNDVAQLNHYHHKTFEDWLIRCSRGQADHCEVRKPHQWEAEKNIFCDVEDKDAYNFMYNL